MNDKDDSYDELLVLARDARSTRKRTNYWTTGLIVTGMAASTGYVATVNQQMDALSKTAETAKVESFRLNVDVGRLQNELDAAIVERDVYKQNAAWFATMAPPLPPGTTNPIYPLVRETPDFALSNLVWYVDGSRRFPMAANDILWVPEGQFWVRLESPDGNLDRASADRGVKPTHITVHDGAEPPASTTGAQTRTVGEYPAGAINLDDDKVYYEQAANRGNANCVRIELADRTDRPQFGTNYVDMVVTFRNAPSIDDDPERTDCRNGVGRRP